ncbi:enoyl-CoA hydratase/isomerase family protein [Neolewinella aurantiaca]|uniref:Enoyl-CoA hydratase/isomerase family protein n=1 Tax=Neolewinella aurantiaca TaxID=2602767 RepID=A0A5C7FPB8_9BACT|nr:enoyl-CoA hydratase/isomerase family protein [Neolewinella aurantiaca]TXF87745.1 enoyl-CoA hydratase/isomerase family protein [Neolewinella aurantiaca]
MNPNGELQSQLAPSGVRTITFGHPAHNSFPTHQLRALVAALDSASQDDATRSVLLRSAGDRTFCAGANLDELLAITDNKSGQEFFMGFANLILAMRRCKKPVVVAVQGKAIGGGVGIAAAADYCLATDAASIKLSELAIAIGPFVILPALVRKMGIAAASELSIDTEWHNAGWAKEKGLYQRVFATNEELYDAATALASKLATYSLQATAELKATLWHGTNHWPSLLEERAGVSGRLVLTDEAKEALSAFKRK